MNNKKPNGFMYNGVLLSGLTLLGNELLKIANSDFGITKVLLISGASLIGGFVLDRLYKDDEYEKLFRMCGIENKDGKVPLIIKKDPDDIKTTLVIHLPEGISQKHFEQKQLEIEQYFNAKVRFGFNKNLIMELIEMTLKPRYDYVFKQTKNPLEVFLGYSDEGEYYLDIEKCQHIIVGGATDFGKSSGLLDIALSLILNSYKVDLHIQDFQDITFGMLEDCRKVKSYGITAEDFDKLLDQMSEESERRLELFRSVKQKVYVEKLQTWNKEFPQRALPYKVVLVDEFGRLSDKEFEPILNKFRLRVQMDRKAGIHYIVALHRCSVDMLSGSIKNNMPTRIAFHTATQTDSAVILDEPGAEKIQHKGRCLIMNYEGLKEIQTLYIEPKHISKLLKQHNAIKTQEEIEIERKKLIHELRKKCINPYVNGGAAANDN